MINLERARQALRQQGIDVLVAASLTNTYYCTGYLSEAWRMIRDHVRFAAIPRDGEPFAVSMDIEASSFTKPGIIKTVEVFPGEVYYRYPPGIEDLYLKGKENIKEFEPSLAGRHLTDLLVKWPVLTLAQGLKRRKLHRGKIAVDERFATTEVVEELKRALPDAQIVDGSQVFIDLRSIKSPQEVQNLREAIKITEEAMASSIPMIKVGASVAEIKANVIKKMSGLHSEPLELIVIDSPLPPGEALPDITARKLGPGSVLRFDIGAKYKGYVADMGRMFSLGEIPDEPKKLFQVLRQAQEAMVEKLRPGAKASDIYALANSMVQRVDPGYSRRLFLGHGIGLEIHEKPYVTPNSTEVVEAGMVMCIEIPHYTAGGYGFNLEDMYLITEKGAEWMSTRLSKELTVL